MAYQLVTPPAIEPVSLAEAKLHLRVDGSNEDTMIAQYLQAAREKLEKAGNLGLLTQTWKLWLDRFPVCPGEVIELDRSPVASVTHVKYTAPDGSVITMTAGDDYIADVVRQPGRIARPALTWPEVKRVPNAVEIQFVAGATAANLVSAVAKQAILLLTGHWYANREAVVTGTISSEVQLAFDRLLNLIRVYQFV